MAKVEITKAELIWPGKYNDDGTRKEVPRVSLPFQVIETINESRATREAKDILVDSAHLQDSRWKAQEECHLIVDYSKTNLNNPRPP